MVVWQTRWKYVVGAGMLVSSAVMAGFTGAIAVSPPATIQATMDLIDPAADALWGTVGTVETVNGEIHKAPRGNAEWQRAASNARTLIAGARHLQRPGLAVGGQGRGLADASTPGTRTPRQIRADIDRDPARFVAAAARLEAGGQSALAAVVARDPVRLIGAGAAIDAACEGCHSAYWYPRSRLTLPSHDQFGRIAIRP